MRVRCCEGEVLMAHSEQLHSLVHPSVLQLTAMAMLSLPSPATKLTSLTLHEQIT